MNVFGVRLPRDKVEKLRRLAGLRTLRTGIEVNWADLVREQLNTALEKEEAEIARVSNAV